MSRPLSRMSFLAPSALSRAAVAVVLVASGWGALHATAQTTAPSMGGVPSSAAEVLAPDPESLGLGQMFSSDVAGIAFRAPAFAKEIHRPVPDEIVTYINEKEKWQLQVSKVPFETDTSLNNTMVKEGNQPPHAVIGLLESTVAKMKLDTPGLEVFRQDVTEFNGNQVAMIAARFKLGMETNLTQQAIVRANDKLYYLFNFTVAAPKDANLEQDPTIRKSVAMFNGMLETVKLLDQTAIRQDQEERLFRTRALFVNFTAGKVKGVLKSEQWLRLQRNGKDIGYSYIVEEEATDLPGNAGQRRVGGKPGVLIGVRSHTAPGAGLQVNADTWMYAPYDRSAEQWTSLVITEDKNNAKQQRIGITESGSSLRREKPVPLTDREKLLLDQERQRDPNRPKEMNPQVRMVEQYELEVTHTANNGAAQPVKRDLPPFYLPQAFGHLLPRLVGKEPKSYLFGSYISDKREVMLRYLDVKPAATVKIGGQVLTAIAIVDRVGADGSPTIHYMSTDGKYLGTVNEEAKITILPTDAATLNQLWPDAQLVRPDTPQKP